MASFITQDLQKILEKFGEGCNKLSWTLTSEKGQYTLCFKWNVPPCDSNTGSQNQALGFNYHHRPVPQHQSRTPVRKRKCPSTIKRDQTRRAFWLEKKRLCKIDLTDNQTEIPVTTLPGTPSNVQQQPPTNPATNPGNCIKNIDTGPQEFTSVTPPELKRNCRNPENTSLINLNSTLKQDAEIITPESYFQDLDIFLEEATKTLSKPPKNNLELCLLDASEVNLNETDLDEQCIKDTENETKSFIEEIIINDTTGEILHDIILDDIIDTLLDKAIATLFTSVNNTLQKVQETNPIESLLIRETLNYVETCIIQELISDAQSEETNKETHKQISIEQLSGHLSENIIEEIILEEASNLASEQEYERVYESLLANLHRAITNTFQYYVTGLVTEESDPDSKIVNNIQTAILYFRQNTDSTDHQSVQNDIATFLEKFKYTDLFYSTEITGSYLHPQVKPFSIEVTKADDGWSIPKKGNKQVTKKAAQNKKDLLVLIDCIKAGFHYLQRKGFRICLKEIDELDESKVPSYLEQRFLIIKSILRNCYRKLKADF